MSEETPLDIYIEWPEQNGIHKASVGDDLQELKEEAQKALHIAMGTIQEMANRVSRAIKEIEEDVCPDEVEVEFSIKLELEGGAVLPLVAKTTAGGQFNVKFIWKIEEQPKTQVLVRAENT